MAVDYSQYARNAGLPLGEMMNAANLGLRMQAIRQQKAAQDAKLARQQEIQGALREFADSPMDVSAYGNMMIRYPEIGNQLQQGYNMLSEAQKKTEQKQALELYSALQSDTPDLANQILDTRIEAAENSGDDDQVVSLNQFKQQLQNNPRSAQAMVGLSLAATMGPENFAKTITALKPPGTGTGIGRELSFSEYQKLTPEQRTEYDAFKGRKVAGAAPGEISFETYQTLTPEQQAAYDRFKGRKVAGAGEISFTDYQRLTPGEQRQYSEFKGRKMDPKTEISFDEYRLLNPQERMAYNEFRGRPIGKTFKLLSDQEANTLGLPRGSWQMETGSNRVYPIGKDGVSITVNNVPTDYMPDEVDKNGDVLSVKPIPGGPADIAAKARLTKESKRTGATAKYGAVVLEDIQRLKDKVQKASWYNPVTGIWAAVLEPVPGTARADAEQLRSSIVANIGFDRLTQMREASPTGGALGSITERELALLQSVLGSLSLVQSQEQLLDNINRVETQYNNILNKARAYPNASEFGFTPSPEDSTGPAVQPQGTSPAPPTNVVVPPGLENRSYLKVLSK